MTEKKEKLSFYEKHSPRGNYLLPSHIKFMDRTGLIGSNNRSPIHGLMHKYEGYRHSYLNGEVENGRWYMNPYSHNSNDCNFDHSTAWRNPGGKWPILVLTEPYYMNEKEIEACEEVTKNSGYRYKLYEPSNKGLWNEDVYMKFWWHKDFYEPDFKVIMEDKND